MRFVALAAFIIVILYIVFMFYQSYKFKKAGKQTANKNVKIAKYRDDTYWLNQCAKIADNHVLNHQNTDFDRPLFSTPVIEKRHPVVTSSQDDLEMLIKYRTHEGVQMERRVTVNGIGKFRNRHYVIGFCHLRNARRTFDVRKFKNSIDLKTGEVITSPKTYILAYNPIITDLTGEFEALEQARIEAGDY